MVYVGSGKVVDLRSGTSKKDRSYTLLVVAGDDYCKHTVYVPEDKVTMARSFPVGSDVLVQISCEDGLNGTRTSLLDMQMKK